MREQPLRATAIKAPTRLIGGLREPNDYPGVASWQPMLDLMPLLWQHR
jgi:hypothetical protein